MMEVKGDKFMKATKILILIMIMILTTGCASQMTLGKSKIIMDNNIIAKSEIISNYIQNHNPKLSKEYSEYLAQIILEHSLTNNIDPFMMTALLGTESDFELHAISEVGAKGFGQLMPVVRKMFGVKEPFDPYQNIKASCVFIKQLNSQWGDTAYGWDMTLASYNLGITATKERVRANKGLPKSVRAYISSINKEQKMLTQIASRGNNTTATAMAKIK